MSETTTTTRSSDSAGLSLTILGLALVTTGTGLDGPIGTLTLAAAVLCCLGGLVVGLAAKAHRHEPSER